MTPEEYHKALEGLVAKWPVAMSALIQAIGPLPDGDSDQHRSLIFFLVRDALEGSIVA